MTNKKWIKSSDQKPEQGKKVLCFNKGDVDVRQRFKEYWFPIPYVDAKLANINEPEMWQEIDFPEGFYGYLQVFIDDNLLKMDQLEKKHPTVFDDMVKALLDNFYKSRNL